jgi:hypothetical protein
MPHRLRLLSTGLVFQARIPPQKYTLALPVLVPGVGCLTKVDLVAHRVGKMTAFFQVEHSLIVGSPQGSMYRPLFSPTNFPNKPSAKKAM